MPLTGDVMFANNEMTNKQKFICTFTLMLGAYATWNVLKFYTALETADLYELLLFQAVIAMFAFIGGLAIIKGDKFGYFFALIAWAVELSYELLVTTKQEGNSYFVSLLSILSLIVAAVLIYDILHDLLHKKT